jgi:hypothetical protein
MGTIFVANHNYLGGPDDEPGLIYPGLTCYGMDDWNLKINQNLLLSGGFAAQNSQVS